MLIRYCTNCEAQLDKQLGFSEKDPYWQCRSCGTMLVNPNINIHDECFPDILWFCNGCGELLNSQTGFRDDCGFWVCEVCEHINHISDEDII